MVTTPANEDGTLELNTNDTIPDGAEAWTPVNVKRVRKRLSTVLLPSGIWNYPLEISSLMLLPLKYRTKSRELLLSNVRDEENHDLALGYIADAYGVDEKAEKDAMALREAWTSHPDHTVLKAMVAERAIFFVLLPFFRFNGDAAMRTTSADISRDEQIHVATNSLVCSELGLNISPSLDKLRKATINWVMQPLQAGNPDKFLDKKFWLDSSDRLMYEGKAPELSATRSARMPAFFEHSNVNLPQYA